MASQLTQTRDVRCPYHLAQRYLADSLSERAASGASGVATIGFPVAGGEVTKSVIVTFGAGVDPMHFDQPWKVHWTPDGGGPFPDFDGELTVRAGEDYTESIVELAGTYRPPGGLAGAAFDKIAGSRIAALTAQRLLEEVGRSMEDRYHRDEAAKHSVPEGSG